MASMAIRRFIKVGGLLRNAKKHGANVTDRSSSGRISYGFYCMEDPSDGSEASVVAPNPETDNNSNMQLFGVFDRQMECLAVAHLQAHFLAATNNHNTRKIRRCTKAAIRNAYKKSMEKLKDCWGAENNYGGFVTLLLESNRKIIVASSGGFEVVLCKGGMATPVGILKSVSELIPCIAHKEAAKELPAERLRITTRDLEPGTRFIILASNGIWEVLGYQEAVHLLNHIKDAQKAAECLAEEAITRLSKSNISCLIIRFCLN